MPPIGRLHLITDTRPGRDPLAVVEAALSVAGPELVVQVRVADDTDDRAAYELAVEVAGRCATVGASCLVNDRLHLALAIGATGGHVGARDLPVDAARRVLGPTAVLGATARDPETGAAAVAAGASYLGVGPCHATSTKDGLPAPIGPEGVRLVASAVPVPVIAIGGITPERVPALMAAGAYGVAVVGAVSTAADPARATAALLTSLGAAPPPPHPERGTSPGVAPRRSSSLSGRGAGAQGC